MVKWRTYRLSIKLDARYTQCSIWWQQQADTWASRQPQTFRANSCPKVILIYVFKQSDSQYFRFGGHAANAKEIYGHLQRGAFRVLLNEDLDLRGCIIGGWSVTISKDIGARTDLYKARFIVKWHLDSGKIFLSAAQRPGNSSRFRCRYYCLPYSDHAFRCRVFLKQIWRSSESSSQYKSKCNSKAPGQLQSAASDPFSFLCTDGGLGSLQGHATNSSKERSKNDQAKSGLSSIFKADDPALLGALALHVDDALLVEKSKFQVKRKSTEIKFESNSREWDNIIFAGVKVDNTKYWFWGPRGRISTNTTYCKLILISRLFFNVVKIYGGWHTQSLILQLSWLIC